MYFLTGLYFKVRPPLKLNFIKRRVSNSEHQPSSLLWIIAISLVTFFIWASFSKIDQVSRAQGQVIASSKTQIIQSGDGGIIQEIYVKEGSQVSKGDVLLRFDKTKVEAAFLETQSKAAALHATKARLNAEIMGGEPKFPIEVKNYPQFKQNQLTLLKKRRVSFLMEIQSLNKMLSLAKREMALSSPLLKTGDVSMTEIIKLQKQVSDLEAQVSNKQNKYFQDTQAEASKTEEDLSSTLQLLKQREDQLNHLELIAPVNGIVKNIKFTTLGGVVKPTEEVMQIVPMEDHLVIEAKAKSSDIAFLKMGLPANVKIDAYDYTIYGTLKGKLIYISPDTLSEDLKQGEQAYYRIQVLTEDKRFSGKPKQNLEIQPGMTATIEVKTGSNTVLKYLLKPMVKTIDESMGER